MAGERQRLLQQAAAAVRRGDLAGAAELYRQLADLVPNDPAVLQRLGDALARMGRHDEARDALRRLARVYRNGGQTNHALAALRRATRIGSPSPEVLEELGEANLEAGRVADARAPLLEASRLYAERRDLVSARRTLERGASASPTDPSFLEALVALTDRIGSEVDRATARAALAVTRCRAGDLAGASMAVGQALSLDPTGEHVFEILSRAEGSFERHPESLPEAPPEGSGAPAGSWATFRARCLVGRPDASQSALGQLERLLEGEQAPTGYAALCAARVLAESDRLDGTDRAARLAVKDLGRSRRFAGELKELLDTLSARDPRRFSWAAATAARLSGVSAFRTGAIAVPGTGPVPATDTLELPDEIKARLFEAEALLEHGLADTARRALRAIPARFQDHPDVLRVLGAAGVTGEERARAPSPAGRQAKTEAPAETALAMDGPGQESPPPGPEPSPAVSEAPAPASQPAAGEEADDGFAIVFDDEAGEGVTEPTRAFGAGAGSEGTGSAAGTLEGPDLAALEEGIGRAVSEADAETSYQMALGLVEMDLFGQARPILEGLLAIPERAASAGILLVRGYREQGQPAVALRTGLQALAAGQGVDDPSRAELAAHLTELALASGGRPEARSLAELIAGIDPSSPLLARLAALAAADS